MEYQMVVVEDNELPDGVGWVIARAGTRAYLLVTQSRYAAPGLGVAWLAWSTLGGFDSPVPLAG